MAGIELRQVLSRHRNDRTAHARPDGARHPVQLAARSASTQKAARLRSESDAREYAPRALFHDLQLHELVAVHTRNAASAADGSGLHPAAAARVHALSALPLEHLPPSLAHVEAYAGVDDAPDEATSHRCCNVTRMTTAAREYLRDIVHDWCLWGNLAYLVGSAGYVIANYSRGYLDDHADFSANMYIAIGVVQVCSALLYLFGWQGSSSPDCLSLLAEYMNVTGALGYLLQAALYQYEATPEMQVLVLWWGGAFALLFLIDSLLYLYAWYIASPMKKRNRGCTYRDLEMWANLLNVLPSIVYVASSLGGVWYHYARTVHDDTLGAGALGGSGSSVNDTQTLRLMSKIYVWGDLMYLIDSGIYMVVWVRDVQHDIRVARRQKYAEHVLKQLHAESNPMGLHAQRARVARQLSIVLRADLLAHSDHIEQPHRVRRRAAIARSASTLLPAPGALAREGSSLMGARMRLSRESSTAMITHMRSREGSIMRCRSGTDAAAPVRAGSVSASSAPPANGAEAHVAIPVRSHTFTLEAPHGVSAALLEPSYSSPRAMDKAGTSINSYHGLVQRDRKASRESRSASARPVADAAKQASKYTFAHKGETNSMATPLLQNDVEPEELLLAAASGLMSTHEHLAQDPLYGAGISLMRGGELDAPELPDLGADDIDEGFQVCACFSVLWAYARVLYARCNPPRQHPDWQRYSRKMKDGAATDAETPRTPAKSTRPGSVRGTPAAQQRVRSLSESAAIVIREEEGAFGLQRGRSRLEVRSSRL